MKGEMLFSKYIHCQPVTANNHYITSFLALNVCKTGMTLMVTTEIHMLLWTQKS